jgi:glutamine amidotransferase
VLVIRTGAANLASVLAAFRRLGILPQLTEDPAAVRAASAVVLPGVGSFAHVMSRLYKLGLDRAIVERVRAGRPTLAICLGFQLLAEASEESPGVVGLGVVDGVVQRFTDGARVPQLGWNRVVADPGCALLASGDAYFANSYRLDARPPGWAAAIAEHGGPFVAGLERGATLACQFHPELSGTWGAALLSRWLACSQAAREETAC